MGAGRLAAGRPAARDRHRQRRGGRPARGRAPPRAGQLQRVVRRQRRRPGSPRRVPWRLPPSPSPPRSRSHSSRATRAGRVPAWCCASAGSSGTTPRPDTCSRLPPPDGRSGSGDPQGWTHLVHTDDVGSAVLAALHASSGVYNVGAAPVRRQDLVDGYAEVVGVQTVPFAAGRPAAGCPASSRTPARCACAPTTSQRRPGGGRPAPASRPRWLGDAARQLSHVPV